MERQAQARPLGSINPPPQGTCTGPAPSPGKRDSVGRSVVAISERELNLASVLSPLRQCPGHAAPVTMSSERPRSPWEGGCQNRCRERDQDWYLSLCCSLASCSGWKVFSDVWGRSQCSLQALSLLEGRKLCRGRKLQGCYRARPEGAFDKPWLFLLPTFLPNTFGPWRLLRQLSLGTTCSSLVQVSCLPLSCPWQLPPNPTPPGLVLISIAQPSVLHAGDFWILPWEGEVS